MSESPMGSEKEPELPSSEEDSELPSRRDLMRRIAALGAGAALVGLPVETLAAMRMAHHVTVFRLRTRNVRCCNACRSHHRFKVFISRAHADRNRAHPGCNCPITKQRLPVEDFVRIFLQPGAIRRGVADLRDAPERVETKERK